jgi:hypothetical protein
MDCFEHDACTYTRASNRCDLAFGFAANDYLSSLNLFCN